MLRPEAVLALVILRAAATYFAFVFGTGFVLGSVRVTLLAPRLGERTAELLEMPWMALAMVLAARLVVRRLLGPFGPGTRAATGGLALALMLGAELAVGHFLLERPLKEILTNRDPVSGSVYVVLLVLFALLPLLLGWISTPSTLSPTRPR